jgi:hypothetical protein
MTARPGPISDDLPCHACGYDLRAHPPDGKCPECGASVAESRQRAAVPRRPAWRDSDPRWRRRILAGVWVLALLPLMDVLQASGWAASVRVPEILDSRGTVRTLDDTLLSYPGVYHPLAICVGVVLLFARERGRRRAPLDWTRRWGVLCSYVVLLLSATRVLFDGALLLAGIGYVFMAMPLNYQPAVTPVFARIGSAYIRYGPQPKDAADVVLVASSSVVILLACIPLFDALASTAGRKRLAAAVLAPLALFALVYLARAVHYFAALGAAPMAGVRPYIVYFRPESFVARLAVLSGPGVWAPAGAALADAAKWCSVLRVAVWLTRARLADRDRLIAPAA